jgi:hypothetical protein
MNEDQMPDLSKQEWLLLLLREQALDRIRLMKALFLIWQRSNRNIKDFYEFVPYMYGPCSFNLYRDLDAAENQRLLVQAPHPVSRWAPYFLTATGKAIADSAASKVDSKTMGLIGSIAEEVQSLPFFELLRRVYAEAPEFAIKSVARAAIER